MATRSKKRGGEQKGRTKLVDLNKSLVRIVTVSYIHPLPPFVRDYRNKGRSAKR